MIFKCPSQNIRTIITLNYCYYDFRFISEHECVDFKVMCVFLCTFGALKILPFYFLLGN